MKKTLITFGFALVLNTLSAQTETFEKKLLILTNGLSN